MGVAFATLAVWAFMSGCADRSLNDAHSVQETSVDKMCGRRLNGEVGR